MTKKFLCFAHRGAKGYAPENTLLAIQQAINMGAEWIEIDVHFVDGHLIVTHDSTVPQGQNVIDLYACSFDEIRAINLSQNQKIPTLEEVLAVIEGSANLNVELKGKESAVPTVSLLLSAIKERRFSEENFFISSFIFDELEAVRSRMPQVKIGVLVEENIASAIVFAKGIRAYSMNIPVKTATKDAIEMIQRNGLKVFVYTVNDSGKIKSLKGLGVDGVFTDYIDICQKNNLGF